MASEPVIGEGNDGVREKQIINVYKRKGKGQRKQTSLFALQASGVTDNSEKQEEKLENEKAINHVSLPESVARESVDTIVEAKNSVEDDALGTNFRVDNVAKSANEASSENVTDHGSDKVIDKPLVEAFSQAESQDGVSLAAMDKNVMQPLPGSLCQDDANTIVGEKSEEVPSQSQKSRDDVNTVVVDENSIKEPLKSLGQGDVTTVIVDKNTIEAPSQTLSMDDTNTVVVDKNPIEVSSEEYVHVVDADNDTLTKKAHTENLAERDAQQPAGLTSDSAHTIPSTTAGIMPMAEGEGGRIRMHVASQSKQQKEETRRKLEDQLSLIRGLVQKIEDKEGEIGAYDDSRINNEGGRNVSEFASDGLTREVIRSPTPLSISLLENTHGVDEHLEKEKRTPKANQFYRTSEFLLGDKLPPAKTNKKSKSNAKKQRGEGGHGFGAGSKVFKNCSALLERLMKHKHGWVFNAPVDAKALGLHDYFTIIEHPMDLGTVKSRLTTNFYKSPRELAEDVRLTFRNAMIYNPKGQDVHVMAEQLLLIFEERYAVIEADYNREMRFVSAYETNLPATTMRSRLGPTMPPPPINVKNVVDRADWSRSHPKSSTTPGRTPTSTTPSGRTPALKKPKANEPNKRDMTYEEKQKLSGHLQNLPPDKLDAIVQIVNKRNTAVKLGDEEVEVDIDSVDPETLWELDRFVTNYKKGLSKKRRKAELALQARAEAERNNQLQMAPAPVANESSREGGTTAKKTLPAPLSSQVEKQNNETSRSSSSGSSSSGSSSTSDSDSDSSSSSGSDQA